LLILVIYQLYPATSQIAPIKFMALANVANHRGSQSDDWIGDHDPAIC